MEKFPEICLLYPPFGKIGGPYISIPVLGAYLRSRNISVFAYDITREFYVKLLSSQNILNGLTYCKERFLELNSKRKLNFSELFEYKMLAITLSEASNFRKDIGKLVSPFINFSDIQNSKAINCFIRAATFPYFPEMIIPEYSKWNMSTYNHFATSDILQASTHSSFQTQIFEKIIREEILQKYHPRIIGFSVVYNTQIIPAFQCARIIKNQWPDIHITMGGPSISIYFRKIQEKRLFDIVDSFIMDEGEIPLDALIRELSEPNPDLSKIPGLVYLTNEHIRFNPSPSSISIEQSPPPDYTMFELDKYLYSKDRLLVPLRLSKGCRWQKCTFCRTNLPLCQEYQSLSMKKAYEQLIHIAQTAGLSHFTFSDDTAAPKMMEYISTKLLEDRIKITWTAHTRVSRQLTKKRCELYRKAGCTSLNLGIESFSDRVLKLMQKGTNSKLIEEVLYEIDGTLPIMAYMMIGFPTETEEEAMRGFERLKHFQSKNLIKYYLYSNFYIMYGSDVWEHPEKYGISDIYPFNNANLYGDVINFSSTGMSREKTLELALKFNQDEELFNRDEDPFSHYSLTTLQLNHEIVPLRYDLHQIESFLTKHTLSFLVSPFIHWLNTTEGELYPIA